MAFDVQGVAGEVGVVVGQVEEVSVAFVVAGGLAPDDGGLVTLLGHRVVDGLPSSFVFILGEVQVLGHDGLHGVRGWWNGSTGGWAGHQPGWVIQLWAGVSVLVCWEGAGDGRSVTRIQTGG